MTLHIHVCNMTLPSRPKIHYLSIEGIQISASIECFTIFVEEDLLKGVMIKQVMMLDVFPKS
jgi:hypothetical protein